MEKLIIFDVDGTLVDVQPIFLEIFNRLAATFGYAPLKPGSIADLKEMHLREVIVRRLGWRIFLLPWILKRGRKEYRALIHTVQMFPGIPEIFLTLRQHGYHIGIVSSSEQSTVQTLLDRFSLKTDFIVHSSLFGKAAVLKRIVRLASVKAMEVIYVGDEVRDVQACQAASIPVIAVTWGLNSKTALEHAGAETVDTREALLQRLLQPRVPSK